MAMGSSMLEYGLQCVSATVAVTMPKKGELVLVIGRGTKSRAQSGAPDFFSWTRLINTSRDPLRLRHPRLRSLSLLMETVNATIPDFRTTEPGMANGGELEDFKHRVDDIFTKVDKLEQRVNEVEQFYLTTSKKQPNNSKASSIAKEKDKEKRIPSIKKLQQEAAHREAAAAKRMQELMRQFGTILRQITQHKWAWPFMQPVDVEGLGLHDYYEVIDRPMDFSTIKNQMEAKDGTGYKNVRDICADVRLVFTNAMKYNDEKSDVHVMAKTLLAKFEEKWLQLLPKVTEEEKRREEEEAQVEINMKLAQEAAHAKMARDLSNEIYEVDMHLEELREMLVQNCRKFSSEEKRKLGADLTRLSPEDLTKALGIVAQNNPSFQAAAEEVDLDIDAQSESTLWRLKFFVKDALETGNNTVNSDSAAAATTTTSKQKCDAIANNAKKRSRKLLLTDDNQKQKNKDG